MKASKFRWVGSLSISVLSLLLWNLSSKLSVAQMGISSDNTLGTERSMPIIQGDSTFIEGGASRGINLFHSFEKFNIDEGKAAYFTLSDTAIENIFSRITGSDPSDILGTLGTCFSGNCLDAKPTATLYFMNPNGIFFGPESSLDLGGSFVVTTANAVEFGLQGTFAANSQAVSSLLDIDPSAFFFNQGSLATIENQSISAAGLSASGESFRGLRVADGFDLFFVGGNVDINGGGLIASGGKIVIGGLSDTGNIEFVETDDGPAITFPEDVSSADVSLRNGAALRVSLGGDGDILFHAENLTLSQGSTVIAGIQGNSGESAAQSGDIELTVAETLTLEDAGTLLFNAVDIGGEGRSGDLTIQAREINIREGARLGVLLLGSGSTGDVDITASDRIEIDSPVSGSSTGVFSQVLNTGNGTSGDIRIKSEALVLNDAAQIVASVFGTGTSGSVDIDATDFTTISGAGAFFSGVFVENVSNTEGNAGNLNLRTGTLTLRDRGRLSAGIFGQGDVGQINITTTDQVILDGTEGNSFILNNIESTGAGTTGGIYIDTDSLVVLDGSQIRSKVSGKGRSGGVSITARGDVSFDGRDDLDNGVFIPSAIFTGIENSNSDDDMPSESGSINISANTLSVTNRAQISSTTEGIGNSGDIVLSANGEIYLLNSIIISEVTEEVGVGNAGNILIEANELKLIDGSALLADTEHVGSAGNITVRASERLLIEGRGPGANNPDQIVSSQISTTVEANADGTGGNINISTPFLLVKDDGFISASTFAQGRAGNIDIVTSEIDLQTGGLLAARSLDTGVAGTVAIKVDEALRLTDGNITTEALDSSGGSISIESSRSASGLSVLRGNSNITTNSLGNGGNITVQMPVVAFDGSDILARSQSANGGNITLGAFFSDTRSFENPLPFEDNDKVDVNADGELSAGNIVIPDTSFIQNELAELSDGLSNPDTLVASSCIARRQEEDGSLAILSRGNLRAQLGVDTTTPYSTGRINTVDEALSEVRLWQPGAALIEPQAVYPLSDGRLLMSRACR